MTIVTPLHRTPCTERKIFSETREQLTILGFPERDLSELPTSHKKFSDGAHFRIEIPTVNSLDTMDAIFNEAVKNNIKINRITETLGLFRHTKTDIKKMVQLCSSMSCELMMSTGPRAAYDTSATFSSPQGKTIGYRLRGQEQLVRAIEDIRRGIEFGVKSFLIYDEGLLFVLGKMRAQQFIPQDIKFKISAHCGHANAAAIQLLESLGANSINPVRDLDLSMLAAIRSAVNIPIDCHTDNPEGSGGFIRVYEAPEIVRVASPVYLKTGNSALSAHGSKTTEKDGIRMIHQASIVLEMIKRYYPIAKQSH